jgi:hypothetical protein
MRDGMRKIKKTERKGGFLVFDIFFFREKRGGK